MNKISELGFDQDSIEALSLYYKVIETMPTDYFKALVHFMKQVRKHEVTGFGYRAIERNGQSAIFSTNNNWEKIEKNADFAKAMMEHMNSELYFVKRNNIRVITRSGIKTHTFFLQQLEQAGINNSIVFYSFEKDLIEIFYYIPNPLVPEANDLVLNNLEILADLNKSIRLPLAYICNSDEFKSQKTQVIKTEILKSLWKNVSTQHFGQKIPINYDGKALILTAKEVECIKLLKGDRTTKYIATSLGVSEFAVIDRIQSLKDKFEVATRKELIIKLKSISINYIEKILDIL